MRAELALQEKRTEETPMMTDRRTLLTILAGAAATAPLLAASARAQEQASGWHETFAHLPGVKMDGSEQIARCCSIPASPRSISWVPIISSPA
ncbi:hypothetical protein [Rhodopseudomonas sp.]|uniref:hypothetical protein n=1 Tax=Rhodopseudomonas sp. TaxID=1078 RepID=UPI0039E3CD18